MIHDSTSGEPHPGRPLYYCMLAFQRFAFVGLLIVSGCGAGLEASVSGMVTLDGKALNSGYVTFSSDTPDTGGSASGQIRSGGGYQVQAGRTGGLPAGRYRVTVIAREESRPNPNGGPPAPGKLMTPGKYAKADSSGLIVDVEPGKNVINLDLASD